MPVALHGGTGLGAADFASFIATGAAKINVSTALKLTYRHTAEEHLAQARARNTCEPLSMFTGCAAGNGVSALVKFGV